MIEHFAGQDLAKRRDYSALVVLQCINNEILKLVFLKEWDHVDYKTVVADTKRYFSSFYWTKLGVDRSGIGDSVVEEYAYENAEGIVFTQKTKEEMIEHIILLRQQGKLILPVRGAEKLIQQIEEQERVITDAGNVKFRHPTSGHDDLLWALALACRVAKQEMEKPLPLVMSFDVTDGTAPNSSFVVENTLRKLAVSGFTITSVKTSMPQGGDKI